MAYGLVPAILQDSDCYFPIFAEIPLMKTATKKVTAPTSQQAEQNGLHLFAWRRANGLNRGTFAKLANFSERSLATYEKAAKIPAPVRPQITEAVRLISSLQEIIPAGDLPKWLQAPNPGFGGKSPWNLIKSGKRDLVWEMIHQTRQGGFG